jgi:transposase-like protein/IS1 family transposase
MKKNKLPLESLACVNDECEVYGRKGQGNLRVRKVYSRDEIRYLRCNRCAKEFSERKGTALWNCKLPEKKAIGIAEQLSEGTCFEGAARLLRVSTSAVQRLAGCLGQHGKQFHDERVRNLPSTALQADERWGYAGSKKQPQWEAEVIDPKSRLVERVLGKRDETLIATVLRGAVARVSYPQGVVLFSDGEHSYKTLFPKVFGTPYQPKRNGKQGRQPKISYRVGRRQAHVRVVKKRQERRLVEVSIHLAHGSQKRLERELQRLGYNQPNTSAIERRNGTARRIDAFNVRKSLAFARRVESRNANGSWSMTIYNWGRANRSLRKLLLEPQGRKHYEQRSPKVAAGLTDFLWSVEDILRYQPFPLEALR